jgi:hypothetical protein
MQQFSQIDRTGPVRLLSAELVSLSSKLTSISSSSLTLLFSEEGKLRIEATSVPHPVQHLAVPSSPADQPCGLSIVAEAPASPTISYPSTPALVDEACCAVKRCDLLLIPPQLPFNPMDKVFVKSPLLKQSEVSTILFPTFYNKDEEEDDIPEIHQLTSGPDDDDNTNVVGDAVTIASGSVVSLSGPPTSSQDDFDQLEP